MVNRNTDILGEVAKYYSTKLAEFGETPQGVDWNGEESQLLRFEQLSKVINLKGGFSVNDVGCGYGALYDFLCSRYDEIAFYGCDVSNAMILAAQNRHAEVTNARFSATATPIQTSDFGIASGIFNVRLGRSDSEWRDYLVHTLDMLDSSSSRGFAFNCLTSYSDPDRMRDHLYYADPCVLFDLCKQRYSRHVALLHDYGLFEFTILVRKSL